MRQYLFLSVKILVENLKEIFLLFASRKDTGQSSIDCNKLLVLLAASCPVKTLE